MVYLLYNHHVRKSSHIFLGILSWHRLFENVLLQIPSDSYPHSLGTTELLIDKGLNFELITTPMTSQSQCTFWRACMFIRGMTSQYRMAMFCVPVILYAKQMTVLGEFLSKFKRLMRYVSGSYRPFNTGHFGRTCIGCPNKSARYNFVIKRTIYSKSADVFISV